MSAISPPRPRTLWWVAARSGVTAALAGACAGVVVAVLCWLPDAGVSGRPSSAIRAGLLSFLAAQHGGITVDGVPAAFVPLGLFLGVILLAWRAGATIADALDDAGEVSSARLVAALLLSALGYAGVCALLVPLARLGSSHVPPVVTPLAAFGVFTLAAGASLARWSNLLAPLGERMSGLALAGLRGAAAASAVYVGAGALLATGSLIVHLHRVMQLSGQVGGGFSGLPVLVIGLACAPNAAVAGGAYLAGPGFAVGSGTTVDAFSTSHGVLPALPLLGAVPDGNGADPVVLAAMCLVALVAAVCVAHSIRRARPAGFWRAVGGALFGAASCGLMMAITCWLAGGRAGAGRLRAVGASSWQVGFAVALTVGVLGLLALAVLAGWDRLVRWQAKASDEPAAARRELAEAGAR